MGKIKVCKKVFEALEQTKDLYKKEDDVINKILLHHAKGVFAEGRQVLHKLTLEEMARILIIGYELEETPEEKLCRYYKMKNYNGLDEKFNEGILCALNTLGIKIEGINS